MYHRDKNTGVLTPIRTYLLFDLPQNMRDKNVPKTFKSDVYAFGMTISEVSIIFHILILLETDAYWIGS